LAERKHRRKLCFRCGKRRISTNGKVARRGLCSTCHAQKDPNYCADDTTMEELDAMVAEQLAAAPDWFWADAERQRKLDENAPSVSRTAAQIVRVRPAGRVERKRIGRA